MAKSKKRPAEAWTYVLDADKTLPEAEQSQFTLRPLTFDEDAAYRDAIRGKDESGRVWRATIALLPDHIVSVDNFPAGNAKPWPASPAERKAYLEEIGVDGCFELGDQIFAHSRVSDDAKN